MNTTDTTPKDNESMIAVFDKNKTEILRFDRNGDVYHLGRKIDIDKEIAGAFAHCVVALTGQEPKGYIHQVEETARAEGYNKHKKQMEDRIAEFGDYPETCLSILSQMDEPEPVEY